MLTFQFAHLQRGDADESVQSSAAWTAFGLPLGTLIVIAITVPQVVGSSWSWRLRQDGFKGCRGGPQGCSSQAGRGRTSWWWWLCGCAAQCFEQVTAPHTPVRFDIHHIAAQAEELFNQIDKDGSGTLSEKELKAAATVAREKADQTRAEADHARSLIRRTPEMRRRVSYGQRGLVDLNGNLHENSLPQSPHENELRRRNKEEEAAATAVLETIIRRLAQRAEQHRHTAEAKARARAPSPPTYGTRVSGGTPSEEVTIPRPGEPSNSEGSFLKKHISRRQLSRALGSSARATRRLSMQMSKPIAAVTARREYEVTKEEWDEAISDALF